MWEKQYLYLSKEPSETEADYVARLRRSFLKPALRNAIEHGKGSVFRYEINDSKVNGKLKPLLDDVDLLETT